MARAAVIGTGFIGPVHVEALRRLGIDVVGLMGSSPERARPKAAALGIPKVYAGLEELLEDRSVDVVHVTSPNTAHHPQVCALLAAGKHVVCEKPLAVTLEESADLVRRRAEAGTVGAVNFNVRYYALAHEMRARVRRGDLGEVFSVHGSYLQDWLLRPTDWNWRVDPAEAGASRAAADIGSHWLDLAGFITGKRVNALCASFRTFVKERQRPVGSVETFSGGGGAVETVPVTVQTEDYASVLLDLEGGAAGNMTVCQTSAGRKNQVSLQVDGSEGSMAWDSERPNELWIGHRGRPNELLLKDPSLMDPLATQFADYPGGHNEGYPDTFKMLYRDVYRAVADGGPETYPTFEDGHEELRLNEAILLSVRERRWVDVEDMR